MDITELRKRIDLLDDVLLRIFNERARLALEIGHCKKDLGLPVFDPSREKKIFNRMKSDNPGPLMNGANRQAVRAGDRRITPTGADHDATGREGWITAMIIIMKKNSPEESLDHVKEYLISRNFDIHQSTGANRTIIGVIGDTNTLDTDRIAALPDVHQVVRIKPEE